MVFVTDLAGVLSRLKTSKTFYAVILAVGAAFKAWLDGHLDAHHAVVVAFAGIAFIGLRDAIAKIEGASPDVAQAQASEILRQLSALPPELLPAPIVAAMKARGLEVGTVQAAFRDALGVPHPPDPPPKP